VRTVFPSLSFLALIGACLSRRTWKRQGRASACRVFFAEMLRACKEAPKPLCKLL
jgi:hypothetical protein